MLVKNRIFKSFLEHLEKCIGLSHIHNAHNLLLSLLRSIHFFIKKRLVFIYIYSILHLVGLWGGGWWIDHIHITHSSQAEHGDRCHAARPLSSWRYVRPLQWLWVNWLMHLATGALASWRGLVRTRLGGPSHSSVIGKNGSVTDGETLTPHYPRVKCKRMNQANLCW